MQPYMLSPTERVRHWRNFRVTFTDEDTDEEQLLRVLQYWQKYPIINYFLDIDHPKNWPSVWEIIMGNDTCRSSLSYLMKQTLLLSDDRWTEDRLRLMLIDDRAKSTLLIILVIDTKYVVNYSHDEIINFDFIDENCIIQYKYEVKNKLHVIKK